jgi:hypothetical protein
MVPTTYYTKEAEVQRAPPFRLQAPPETATSMAEPWSDSSTFRETFTGVQMTYLQEAKMVL